MDEKQLTEDMVSTGQKSSMASSTGKKGVNILIPYFVALGGAILAVAANFIPYIKISNLFFYRNISIFSLIMESLDNPDQALGSVGDKVLFGAFIAAIVFSLLVVLFVGIRKMVPAIVFTVLAALPLLIPGSAYIHYIGLAIALGGAIWYKVIAGKQKKNTDQ